MDLEEAEVEKYREIFDAFDVDNSGCITHGEMKTVLNDNLGYRLTDSQIREMIDDADEDGDGTLSWDEFLGAVSGRPKFDRQKAHMRRLFRAFDADGSGYITVENLQQILAESGVHVDGERLEAFIAEGDTDDDGRISYEEFVAMVESEQEFPPSSE